MTKRDLSWLVAGAIGAAAIIGFVTWRAQTGASSPAAAAAAPPAATAAPGAMQVPSVEESTAKLAARLEKDGGSREDWRLLGESYQYLGRKAEADAAFARAEKAAPANPAPAPAATAAGPARISGTVELAGDLRSKADPAATLFIYAKSAALRGPPLAVLRLPAPRWPVSFTLDDSNSMMPAANLSSASSVTVEARVSPSGNALPQAGDLVGSVANVSPRQGGAIRIVIDRAVGSTQ